MVLKLMTVEAGLEGKKGRFSFLKALLLAPSPNVRKSL